MKTPPVNKKSDHKKMLPNLSSKRKKIKLRHAKFKSRADFDFTSLDSAFDLKCDIELEYKKQLFGEDENKKPVHPNILHDLSDHTTSCNKVSKEKDKMPSDSVSLQNVQNNQDFYDYEESVSRTRKYLNYLNTLEDDEELMFSVRAKLFEYVEGYDHYFNVMNSHLVPSNQVDGPARWIERGIGQVKFLRDLEEGITCGTVRIAMQHEGTLKLLMNHLVEPGLEVGTCDMSCCTCLCLLNIFTVSVSHLIPICLNMILVGFFF